MVLGILSQFDESPMRQLRAQPYVQLLWKLEDKERPESEFKSSKAASPGRGKKDPRFTIFGQVWS